MQLRMELGGREVFIQDSTAIKIDEVHEVICDALLALGFHSSLVDSYRFGDCGQECTMGQPEEHPEDFVCEEDPEPVKPAPVELA